MTTNLADTSDTRGTTSWRRLPAVVWALVLARAVNRLGALTLPFLAVVLVGSYDASVATAGYLLAGFGLATIPSRLFGGRLSDRIGTRATILVGLVGTAAAQLGVALAGSLVQAAVAVVLLGLAFEIYEPPSQAIIADVTLPEQRAVAFSLLGAAMAGAGMGAGLLAAALAGLDLRWLLVADAASCLACAAVVAALLPGGRPAPPEQTDDPGRESAGVRPWSDRRLLLLLGTGTVFAVVYLQVTIALPLTLTGRGLPASTLGLLLTLGAATMVLGQPLLRLPHLRRLDDFRAMTLGYLVLAAGLLLTGLVTSRAGFAVATLLTALGDLVLLGRAYAVVVDVSPAHARGRYLAVYGTSWGLAAIVAPLLGTQLLVHGGPVLTWTVVAALCLVLAAAQPAIRRRLLAPCA
ncbi:MFS transporter [Nocardioides luti]|uniref:MFS transporter n=1 Tax=Nocardioides luti TaxID=2761101 RepID=UPI0031B5FC0B